MRHEARQRSKQDSQARKQTMNLTLEVLQVHDPGARIDDSLAPDSSDENFIDLAENANPSPHHQQELIMNSNQKKQEEKVENLNLRLNQDSHTTLAFSNNNKQRIEHTEQGAHIITAEKMTNLVTQNIFPVRRISAQILSMTSSRTTRKQISPQRPRTFHEQKIKYSAILLPKKKLGILPKQGAGILPEQGAGILPNQGAGILPEQGAGILPEQGAGILPNQGAGILPNQRTDILSNQGTGVLPNQAASTLPKQGTNIGAPKEGPDILPNDTQPNQKPNKLPKLTPILPFWEQGPSIKSYREAVISTERRKMFLNQRQLSPSNLVINAFLMHNKTSATATNTSKPQTIHKTGFSLIDRGKAILHHHCGGSLYDTSRINFGKKITTLYKVHLLVVLNTPYWKVSK